MLAALLDDRRPRRGAGRRPSLQIVTCADVREEGLRRHLEAVDPDCETFGADGVFGVPMRFRGREDVDLRPACRAGVEPTHAVIELPSREDPTLARRFDRGLAALRRWRTFVGRAPATWVAPVFAWIGLLFPRRLARVHRWLRSVLLPAHGTVLVAADLAVDVAHATPHAIAGFSLGEQVDRVHGVLQELGSIRRFARIVVVLGHRGRGVGEAAASAFDCDACGGHPSGPNARLFCAMANSPAVRAGLRVMDIDVPDDTWFVAGEHRTDDDDLEWFDAERVPTTHVDDMAAATATLEAARRRNAYERCCALGRTPRDTDDALDLVHALLHRAGPTDRPRVRP